MNIICIGYFDKFSRFFLDIKKHIKANHQKPLRFKIYSVYFSGFLYAFIRFQRSSWLPVKAWYYVFTKKKAYKNIIDTSKSYKGIEYGNYVKFHLALNKSISEYKLKLQALAYIDIYEALYNKEKPDFLLCIGDCRMAFEIAIALAKHKNIKVYFLEQGPFNTTFFDDKGVNANLSIRNTFDCDSNDYQSVTTHTIEKSLQKYSRSPIYRGFDLIIRSVFEATNLYPPDIKFTDLNSYRNKNRVKKDQIVSVMEKEILVILQVPLDVNMIYHSPHFKNHVELVKAIFENKPEDYQLIVREHPLYINKYESELYNYINENHIVINNTVNLEKAIKDSSIVVVNNSTVGLEALFYNKPLFVLGNAFYDDNSICYKYTNDKSLKYIMKLATENKVDTPCIEKYKQFLYNTVLIQGSMSEKNLRSSKTIASKLIEYYVLQNINES